MGNGAAVRQKLTYVCRHCGETVSETHTLGIDSRALVLSGPAGWVRIGADLFCNRHRIAFTVDGDQYEIWHG